jgi:hypothetical protein
VTDDGAPLLRDRNWFFHQLLNGDPRTFQETRPRWKEQKRNARRAQQPGPPTEDKPRRTPGPGDAKFEAMLDQVARDDRVKSAWRRLQWAAGAARRRIDRAARGPARDDAAIAKVREDATEIEERLRKVRKRIRRIEQRSSPSPFDQDAVTRLTVTFVEDHKERRRKYKDVVTLLEMVDQIARSARRDIRSRRKALEQLRRQRIP